jgi:hypothetical protein
MTKNRRMLTAALAAVLLPIIPAHAQTPVPSGVDLRYAQWGLTAVRATEAWTVTRGRDVVVAVLDTGVDGTHPDLAGRVLDGWSTVLDIELPAGEDSDVHGHGTHVAAQIAGDDDGDGVSGVAPEALILPVQVLGGSGGSDLTVAEGIDWAVENGADVINMSLGGDKSIFDKGGNLSCEAVARAQDAGVVVVVAAGNSGGSKNPEHRPASCRGAISVAALDENLDRTFFSSFDATVTIAAPGRRIVSALPMVSLFPYDQWDGTSMAAPFVAGAAALIIAANPDKDAAFVADRLRRSAVDLGATGLDPETGYGLVDAAAALGMQPTDAASVRSAIRKVTTPRITSAVSDTERTTLRWEPPFGASVSSYRIRHTAVDGNVTETTLPGDQLGGVLESDAWSGGFLVVIAVTAEGERPSFPATGIDVDFPVAEYVPQPKIKKFSTRWVKAGLEVTFSTTGPSGTVDVTLLDWEYALFSDVRVDSKSGRTVIPVPVSSEVRAHSSVLIIGNEEKRINRIIKPQFQVSGVVLNAGKGRIGVQGSTINACFSERIGCQGALVEIIDGTTGRKLGSARVLVNLNFAVVLKRQPDAKTVVVVIGRHKTPLLPVPAEGAK